MTTELHTPATAHRTAARGCHRALAPAALALVLALAIAAVGCSSAETSSTLESVSTPSSNEPTTAVPANSTVTEAATALVQLLAMGDFAAAEGRFDPTMKQALPEEKLREVWTQVEGQAGAFQEITGVRAEKQAGYEVALVTARFGSTLLDLKVVYDADGLVAGLFFAPSPATEGYEAPAYVDETAFSEQEVEIGSDPWKLPGTLTIPNGEGPFPAVVLVHGSGPNDRDETIGPNKPFKDLAWGLASLGIAVLRYEKRTKQYQAQMATLGESITTKEEVLDDAGAAVDLLRGRAEVDPEQVFVLGHSLGAMLAPRLAEATPGISGVIMMATPARPLEELIVDQVEYLAAIDGAVSPEEEAQLATLREQAARVKDPKLSSSVPAGDLPLGIAAPYWLDLRGYHPEQVAAGLSMPLLVLQGARDYQVTTGDFGAWETALAGHDNAKLVLYPDLNHLFVVGEGASTPAEYEQPGHVSEQVILDLSSWVRSLP